MEELIHPEICPYRSDKTLPGQFICTYRPERRKYQDENDANEREMFNSGSASDIENEQCSPEPLDIEYDFSIDGDSVDVNDASDIDISFDGTSAEYDFDCTMDSGGDSD